MNQTLFTFLPLIVLTLFNILLVRVVIGAARQRETMTSATDMTTGSAGVSIVVMTGSAGDQQRITVMLICVVVVFLVCQVKLHFNLFIKQKYRSATYIDMHEIHVETL